MTDSATATTAPAARAEIRKRQNRDSARRSRERRKSHLRGVFESVEAQSRRVLELDQRVAQLEALVRRVSRAPKQELAPPPSSVVTKVSPPRTAVAVSNPADSVLSFEETSWEDELPLLAPDFNFESAEDPPDIFSDGF